MRRSLILFALACCFIVGPSTARPPSAWADTPADAGVVLVDAGAVVAPPPAADLPSSHIANPATNPIDAWNEAKAARKTSWPILAFLLLTMLTKGLAYSAEAIKTWPLVGAAAVWLTVGKRAAIVTGLGTLGAAGYDALIAGGSLTAALVAGGMAWAGAMHSTIKGAAAPPAAT